MKWSSVYRWQRRILAVLSIVAGMIVGVRQLAHAQVPPATTICAIAPSLCFGASGGSSGGGTGGSGGNGGNSSTVPISPSPINKSVDPASVPVGGTVTVLFSFQVSSALTNVTIKDTLAKNIKLVDNSVAFTDASGAVTNPSVTRSNQGGATEFEFSVGSLAPSTGYYTVRFAVQDNNAPGSSLDIEQSSSTPDTCMSSSPSSISYTSTTSANGVADCVNIGNASVAVTPPAGSGGNVRINSDVIIGTNYVANLPIPDKALALINSSNGSVDYSAGSFGSVGYRPSTALTWVKISEAMQAAVTAVKGTTAIADTTCPTGISLDDPAVAIITPPAGRCTFSNLAFAGVHTLIVDGDVTISGDMKPSDINSSLGIVALGGTITIGNTGGRLTVSGVALYADKRIDLSGANNAALEAKLAAGEIDLPRSAQSLVIDRSANLDSSPPPLFRDIRLPQAREVP